MSENLFRDRNYEVPVQPYYFNLKAIDKIGKMFVHPKEILVSGPLWVTERTNVRLMKMNV